MTYIGLSPPNTFTKSTSQTFTGNGSTTAFTLQTRVASPEDLEVFVSNVQQQPTESYTIGSDGVTMTFSEAPPSGTFYVIYRTVAQQAGTDTGASRLGENNTFTGTNTFNDDVTFTGANYNAVWDKSDNRFEFADDAELSFGNNNDLKIKHNNNGNSVISETGSGSLFVQATNLFLQDANGNTKLNTYTSGVSITGALNLTDSSAGGILNVGSSSDLQIYHNGSNTIFNNQTGNLFLIQGADDADVYLQCDDQTGGQATYIWLDGSEGEVKLRHASSGSATTKLTTKSTGVEITGSLDMNGGEVILDADADTSITADTDDQIDIKVGGTDEMKLTTSGIVINEGGNSRDFRVEGDNKDNLLLVDGSADKIGINTSSPDALLDVEGTTDAEVRITRTTATTASTFNDAGSVLNLVNNVNYENGYNGGASIGQILFTSNDSSLGTGVRAKISCKATTYYHAEDLQFFVSPSNTGTGQVSATSQTDGLRMNIAPTGKTSIFADSSSTAGHIQNAFSSPYGLSIFFSSASPNNTTNWFLSCADNASQNFIVFSNGDAKNDNGVYTSFSDERLKTNIVDAKSQWEDIKALKFKNFIKFSNPDLKQLGLVAQDVEKTSPNLVFETPPDKFEIKHNSVFGTLYEEGDELPEGKEVGDVKEVKSNVKNVKDSILYMKSVKALQEAIQRIETLEAKVKILEEA